MASTSKRRLKRPWKLDEAAGKVPGADPATYTEDVAFEVAKDRVHPLEGRVPELPSFSIHHDVLVVLNPFFDGIEAGRAVDRKTRFRFLDGSEPINRKSNGCPWTTEADCKIPGPLLEHGFKNLCDDA
jgi:hypothetical protein